MSANYVESLRAFQGFSALSDSALAEVSAFVSARKIRAGETIFCQGEPSPYFFGVCSGEVLIQRVSKDNRFPVKVLGIVGAGGLFGESSIFEESPRAAMASAYKDGELLLIRGAEFRNWLAKSPEVSQPLLLSLLKTATYRLYRTSHELTVIYGVGRLLGSAKSFEAQLDAAMDFLKSSLDGLDDIVMYQRSPYWDEFNLLKSLPMMADLPAVPMDNELVHKVNSTGAIVTFEPKTFRLPLEAYRLDWESRVACALIPLYDWERPAHALQGLILLSSATRADAFSPEKQLLLTSVSQPIAEALARFHRLQDAQAQERLQKSRQSYPQ